jgi:hypothetical protein
MQVQDAAGSFGGHFLHKPETTILNCTLLHCTESSNCCELLCRFKTLLGPLEAIFSKPETTILERLRVGGGQRMLAAAAAMAVPATLAAAAAVAAAAAAGVAAVAAAAAGVPSAGPVAAAV